MFKHTLNSHKHTYLGYIFRTDQKRGMFSRLFGMNF